MNTELSITDIKLLLLFILCL